MDKQIKIKINNAIHDLDLIHLYLFKYEQYFNSELIN